MIDAPSKGRSPGDVGEQTAASVLTPITPLTRSLDRNGELVVAAVYERVIGASLERVWENVYDWEHLPWLHSEAFGSIDRFDSGRWGWHARIGVGEKTEAAIELELITDEPGRRYVSRTLAGGGAPSEIWTELSPVASDRTAIRVEFCVQPVPEEILARVGEGYVSLYTLLWDQDEDMMQTRETALSTRASGESERENPVSISLGTLDEVRRRLPLSMIFAGEAIRIVDIEGELFAHATTCPHLLGPLDRAEVVEGCIECPWHGYRFDVRTGRSCEGRGLRLPLVPELVIDGVSQEVTLRRPGSKR